MAGFKFANNVLNQKGSPALFSDVIAGIPEPGFTGRIFVSTDTHELYRDNGSDWDLIGGGGGGGLNLGNSDLTQISAIRTFTGTDKILIFDDLNYLWVKSRSTPADYGKQFAIGTSFDDPDEPVIFLSGISYEGGSTQTSYILNAYDRESELVSYFVFQDKNRSDLLYIDFNSINSETEIKENSLRLLHPTGGQVGLTFAVPASGSSYILATNLDTTFSAQILFDNIDTSNKTFQFPNESGTLALEGGGVGTLQAVTDNGISVSRDYQTDGGFLLQDNGDNPAGGRIFLKFIPSNGSGSDTFLPQFTIAQWTAIDQNLPGSTNSNYTYFLGMNTTQTGTPINTDHGTIGISMEGFFLQGGAFPAYQEFHLIQNYKTSVGGGTRFLTYAGAEDGTSNNLGLQCDTIGFLTNGAVPNMTFITGATESTSIFHGDHNMTFEVGDRYPISQNATLLIGADDGGVGIFGGIIVIRTGGEIVPGIGGTIILGSASRPLTGGLEVNSSTDIALTIKNSTGADNWLLIKTSSEFQLGNSASTFVPFKIHKDAPNNSLTVSGTGNVGVGTTSSYKLTVVGTSATIALGLTSLNTADDIAIFQSGTIAGNFQPLKSSVATSGIAYSEFRNAATSSGAESRIEISTAATSGNASAYLRLYTTVSDWSLGTRRGEKDFQISAAGSLYAVTAAIAFDYTTNDATFGGKASLVAATTAKASLNIPSGSAPTTPNNGDIWFDGTDLKIRISGATKTFTVL